LLGCVFLFAVITRAGATLEYKHKVIIAEILARFRSFVQEVLVCLFLNPLGPRTTLFLNSLVVADKFAVTGFGLSRISRTIHL